MRRRCLIILYLMLLAGAGCLTEPPGQTVKTDPGPYPQNYEKLILCYMNHYLYEPESFTDFEVTKPPEKVAVDTFYPSIPLTEGQMVWEAFVVFNARNESGKYVGRDLHVVWIRHDKVVAFDYKDIGLEFSIEQRFGDPCAPGNEK